MDKTDGTPEASRHLRPTYVPEPTRTIVREVVADPEDELSEAELEEMFADLAKLREPFAETEQLPKPMWKSAWEGESKGRCDICGGYHVLVNTLHLAYVGHAETTKRLLDIDPLWNWEPLALDQNGLPRFDGFGGLWIKLTVCGVTRLGYGDATGKAAGSTAVKEIIGDAIRNAAMRFGVALDLWSKLDTYEAKNPSATAQASSRQSSVRAPGARVRGRGSSSRTVARDERKADLAVAADRAPNQDALDALQDVCNEYGYSTQYCIDRWAEEHDGEHIRDGDPDGIFAFAEKLLIEATPEPADTGGAEGGESDAVPDAAETGAGAGDNGMAVDNGADEAQAGPPPDPEDTSDVEKKPGEMF